MRRGEGYLYIGNNDKSSGRLGKRRRLLSPASQAAAQQKPKSKKRRGPSGQKRTRAEGKRWLSTRGVRDTRWIYCATAALGSGAAARFPCVRKRARRLKRASRANWLNRVTGRERGTGPTSAFEAGWTQECVPFRGTGQTVLTG